MSQLHVSVVPRPVLLLGLLLSLVWSGCDGGSNDDASSQNLLTFIIGSEDFTLLEEVIDGTELATLLQQRTEYTFFAPTDFALDRLGSDLVLRLQYPSNQDVLFKILRRHIVPGRLLASDLQDGMMLTPLEGPPLQVRVEDDQVFVGGVPLTARRTDFETGNGVIHYVDDVVRDHLTLRERLRVTPSFLTFSDVLEQTQLGGVLNRNEPYTLFIPISESFTQLPGTDLPNLQLFRNRGILTKVVGHHIVPGLVQRDALVDGGTLAPIEGGPLTIEEENGTVYLDGARVVTEPIETTDGLIYLLDEVILGHLNLFERVQLDRNLMTVMDIFEAANVMGVLRTQDPLTVLAPRDEAFESLGEAFTTELASRPALLDRVAKFYLVPERLSPDDLRAGGSATTLSGFDIDLSVNTGEGAAEVFVDGVSRVAFPPVEAKNGLLYTSNPVYFPPANLVERALLSGFYRFTRAVTRAGLNPLLEGDAEYTVFAPAGTSLPDLPPDQLAEVLRRHIVAGRYNRSDLSSGTVLESLAGTPITIEIIEGPGGGFFANGVRYSGFELSALNGALYTLEGIFP